ncbi:hypothetical protein HPB51_005721 [Rhipicephalus microplus]|uniref:Golgin subfamily A member 1 n=1 Tax=Rhipicephalus microplus TaxID=6941 RepID=A0A9J6E6P3_RHIMP|nr:hypothetical protein HPB51_005721 [Rhipicephalus microplus]
MMLKLQQQRMSDMKKTLQKELKNHQGAATVTAVLNIEGSSCTASDVPPPVDHGGSAGDSAAKAETALQDAAQPQRSDSKLEDDINFKYLKHVVFKFMTSKEDEAQHLIRAVSVLLRFTADEEQMIREHLEWKNSWVEPPPSEEQEPQRTTTVQPPDSLGLPPADSDRSDGVTRTRSGRRVVPPNRLNL